MKKGYKKTKTWLKKLPLGYRERALSQIDEDWFEYVEKVGSISDALMRFNDWGDTIEGVGFWNCVNKHYSMGSDLPPLPEPEATHCIDVDSPEPQGIDATLQERGNDYGDWRENAERIEELHAILTKCTNYDSTPAYVKGAFKMICTKMVRCLNGNWKKLDNPIDIQGFAALIVKEMEKKA